MQPSLVQFQITHSRKSRKQFSKLSQPFQWQYEKAFALLQLYGPRYQSLRTHRYHVQGQHIWGSSASMFLRFYWDYSDKFAIFIILLGSH